MLTPGVRVQVPPRAPKKDSRPNGVAVLFSSEGGDWVPPVYPGSHESEGFPGKRKNDRSRDSCGHKVFAGAHIRSS